MLDRREFYVYIIFRPSGAPCYVGKGCGKRWREHFKPSYLKRHHNERLARIIKNAGGSLPVVIIRSGLTNQQAIDLEKAFIAAIGRSPNGPLVNMTDGGDGQVGLIFSQATRQKMREAALGRINGPETRARISASNKGKTITEEQKKKMSFAHMGMPGTMTGRKHSDESRAKMSATQKGKKKSPEHRAKIGIAGTGRRHSEMTIELIRHKLVLSWIRRKNVSEDDPWPPAP
jgi:group I intron endonuclease